MNPVRWIIGLGYAAISVYDRVDTWVDTLEPEDINAFGCGLLGLFIVGCVVGFGLAAVFALK